MVSELSRRRYRIGVETSVMWAERIAICRTFFSCSLVERLLARTGPAQLRKRGAAKGGQAADATESSRGELSTLGKPWGLERRVQSAAASSTPKKQRCRRFRVPAILNEMI